MIAMIAELNRRQAELFTLLRKKDLEIMDYKESGVRLSRSKNTLGFAVFVLWRKKAQNVKVL